MYLPTVSPLVAPIRFLGASIPLVGGGTAAAAAPPSLFPLLYGLAAAVEKIESMI